MNLKKGIALLFLPIIMKCYLPYDKEKIADYYIRKAKQTYKISLQLEEVIDSLENLKKQEESKHLERIKKLERRRDSLINLLREYYREVFF